MIKLKNIILESNSIDILQKECSQALELEKKGILFYRGVRNVGQNFFSHDPSKRQRVAKDWSNYANLMFDNLVGGLHNKRNWSVIFTQHNKQAEDYGQLYRVYPVDNSKITRCQVNDFNISTYPNVDTMCDGIDSLLSEFLDINPKEHISKSNDFNYVKDVLLKLDKNLNDKSEVDLHAFTGYNLAKSIKQNGGVYNLLRNTLDPVMLKIETFDLMNFPTIYNKNETWTESICYLDKVSKEDDENEDG